MHPTSHLRNHVRIHVLSVLSAEEYFVRDYVETLSPGLPDRLPALARSDPPNRYPPAWPGADPLRRVRRLGSLDLRQRCVCAKLVKRMTAIASQVAGCVKGIEQDLITAQHSRLFQFSPASEHVVLQVGSKRGTVCGLTA